jgi:voltage-gated potassium channel
VLKWFEVVSVFIFTVEYILRLWTCVEQDAFSTPLKGRIKFMFTPLAVVDLLAILPFYLPMFITLDLRFLRILRLFRIFRLLKMARYLEHFSLMAAVVRRKKEELIITLFMAFMLLILSASLIYYAEREAQPQAFSSIPRAMWWSVNTLTTVGYGDVYPVTAAGRLLGGVIALLGIGVFALPAGILGSGFVEELQKKKARELRCPHCGRSLNLDPGSRID